MESRSSGIASSIFRLSTGHLAERITECAHCLQPSARQKHTSGGATGEDVIAASRSKLRLSPPPACRKGSGSAAKSASAMRDLGPLTYSVSATGAISFSSYLLTCIFNALMAQHLPSSPRPPSSDANISRASLRDRVSTGSLTLGASRYTLNSITKVRSIATMSSDEYRDHGISGASMSLSFAAIQSTLFISVFTD